MRNSLVVWTAFALFSGCVGAAPIVGGSTSVALDSGTVSALQGLGFTIGALSPATLTGLNALFPINPLGSDTNGVINHFGGLLFTDKGVTTTISAFQINPASGVITGNVNGATGSATSFFDLSAGPSAGTVTLKLDAALAAALVSVYGVPNLTGATIGVATVNATAVPEPQPAALLLLAIGFAAVLTRARWQ